MRVHSLLQVVKLLLQLHFLQQFFFDTVFFMLINNINGLIQCFKNKVDAESYQVSIFDIIFLYGDNQGYEKNRKRIR